MLYALNFTQNIIDEKQLNYCRDKDLFESAKKEVTRFTDKNNHFAIMISTLDTHFPNGIYDSRMEKFLPKQESNLKFIVSAVDYLVKDFITFLEQKNILDNTIVFIFPDHLKMGDGSIFNSTGKRILYLITNASKRLIDKYCDDILYQIDLPKIIMDGAEIKHNFKFLADYISEDKNEFIKNNITNLTKINISGLFKTDYISPIIPKLSENYEHYKDDTNRFIAHAAGAIDGYIYTNSLEALNENYNRGFRKFELDIRKTSDGKYVSVHKWSQWASFTNFKGKTPVIEEVFLKYKIHGKYTPLNMERINIWFKNHKDAILVTDKINEPIPFSKQFIDKKRLIMELFSWKAINEAIDMKIKSAMPSSNLIGKFGIDKLKSLGITEVVIPRNIIYSNIELLKSLKKHNIKAYAFGVRADIGKDEDYMVKYEMDLYYGIYADNWKFSYVNQESDIIKKDDK